MIFLYSGTPGSGKSLHTASMIYYRLKRKRPVIANFGYAAGRIGGAEGFFLQVDNDKLSPDFLVRYANDFWARAKKSPIEGFIALVIDEAQLVFNAREWDAKGRKEWLSFFTQHRKLGYDIYLVAQFDRMLDRQIRCLIEYEYVHRKVSNFGWKGFLFSLFAGGHLFVAVKVWYPLHEKVGSDFFRARKKFYSLYDTYNTFGSAAPSGGTAAGAGHGVPAASGSAVGRRELLYQLMIVLKMREKSLGALPSPNFFHRKMGLFSSFFAHFLEKKGPAEAGPPFT